MCDPSSFDLCDIFGMWAKGRRLSRLPDWRREPSKAESWNKKVFQGNQRKIIWISSFWKKKREREREENKKRKMKRRKKGTRKQKQPRATSMHLADWCLVSPTEVPMLPYTLCF